MAYVLHVHTQKYLICRHGEQIYVSVYTQGACKAIFLYIIHMSWICAGSCTQKIQMFCFGSCVHF